MGIQMPLTRDKVFACCRLKTHSGRLGLINSLIHGLQNLFHRQESTHSTVLTTLGALCI
jgi:hypothetical protein